jgi:hypothetical protein
MSVSVNPGDTVLTVMPREAHRSRARRDVDDPAAVLHPTCGFLKGEERSLRVQCECRVEFLLGDLGYGMRLKQGRVVHQNIEASEALEGCLEQAANVRDLAHIGLHSHRARPRCFDRRDHSGGGVGSLDIVDHDGRAFPSRRSAMARPIPLDAPVTIATLPVRPPMATAAS